MTNEKINNIQIKVYFWMPKLGITSNDLLTYAFLYGYEKEKGIPYNGGIARLSKIIGLTIRGMRKVLQRLIDKKLILRYDPINVGRNYDYGINKEMIKHI
jgi:DNA-binding MarR family transcriptional regulator